MVKNPPEFGVFAVQTNFSVRMSCITFANVMSMADVNKVMQEVVENGREQKETKKEEKKSVKVTTFLYRLRREE